MTSNSPSNTIYVKEFNPELIAPSTSALSEPENFGGSKTIIIGKPGCFVKDTLILMYDGSLKKVQDVEVGDVVMGDDSTPRNVLETCYNFDEMFKVIPLLGENYTVNKQHKLVLKSNLYDEPVEISVENYLKESEEFRKVMKIYRTAVDFPREKPVNFPYYTGKLYSTDSGLSKLFGMIYDTEQIPVDYKVNTRDVRLSVLAGVLDSVGLYDNEKLGYYVVCKKRLVLEDIIFIARSLGFSVERSADCETCFIRGDFREVPFKRPQDEKILFYDSEHQMSEFTLISQGEGEYWGFTLDGNHRFVLGTFDVVRNTGKSTVIASLLYAKKHIFPVGIAFSGSEDSNGFFGKIMPSSFVFNEYSEDQIKSFIRRQKIAKQHLQNPWAVMILDDCTDDPRIFNTPLQQGIFKRGRHWSCWYIVSLQYAMDVKPVVRTNTDGVFILREPILKNRKSLWENYASIIPDFTTFCTLMDALTDDFCCMYVSNQTRTNDWRDCVYWYKATKPPEGWKFGSPEYHHFHEERYNESYVDPFD